MSFEFTSSTGHRGKKNHRGKSLGKVGEMNIGIVLMVHRNKAIFSRSVCKVCSAKQKSGNSIIPGSRHRILSLAAVSAILKTRKHDKLTILNHNSKTSFLLIRKLN
jgi:hypothetical protein